MSSPVGVIGSGGTVSSTNFDNLLLLAGPRLTRRKALEAVAPPGACDGVEGLAVDEGVSGRGMLPPYERREAGRDDLRVDRSLSSEGVARLLLPRRELGLAKAGDLKESDGESFDDCPCVVRWLGVFRFVTLCEDELRGKATCSFSRVEETTALLRGVGRGMADPAIRLSRRVFKLFDMDCIRNVKPRMSLMSPSDLFSLAVAGL